MDDPCPRLIVRSRLPAAVQRYPPRRSGSFAEEPGSMFAALGKERPCSANGAYNGKTGSRISLHRLCARPQRPGAALFQASPEYAAVVRAAQAAFAVTAAEERDGAKGMCPLRTRLAA